MSPVFTLARKGRPSGDQGVLLVWMASLGRKKAAGPPLLPRLAFPMPFGPTGGCPAKQAQWSAHLGEACWRFRIHFLGKENILSSNGSASPGSCKLFNGTPSSRYMFFMDPRTSRALKFSPAVSVVGIPILCRETQINPV